MADRLAGTAGGRLSPALHPVVGIDVVDLSDPRSGGKAADTRFVERIFASEERRWIEGAEQPDVALWSLWGAKEAAFKALSALRGRAPVFRHRAFETTLETPPREGGGFASGLVSYEGDSVPVVVGVEGDCILALGWPEVADGAGAPPRDTAWGIGKLGALTAAFAVGGLELDELRRRRFSEAEARAIHSRPSALARLAARAALSTWMRLDEPRITIVCAEGPTGRVPPRVHVDGAPSLEAGVSLSHHGMWTGWAVRATRAGSVGRS